MHNKINVYYNQSQKGFVQVIGQDLKYRKVLIINGMNFSALELKKALVNEKVNPIEIILNGKKELDEIGIGQLLCVNEDIRAVVCFDQTFFNVSKCVAQIKGVPCYLYMKGIYPRTFCDYVYIRNANSFDKVCFSQSINVFIEQSDISIEISLMGLACYVTVLADYLISQKLMGKNVDENLIDEVQTLIKFTLKELENENKRLFFENTVKIQLLIDRNFQHFLPSFEIASMLLGECHTTNDKARLSKEIIDLLALAVSNSIKKPLRRIDYSSKAVELSLMGLNRLSAVKALTQQLRELKRFDVRHLVIEIKLLKGLFYRLTTLCENKSVLSALNDREMCAVKLAGDTYLGLNAMTLVRELCV